MRNTIIGTVAGLLVGILGTLGYSHFFGAESQVDQAQAEFVAAKTDADKAKQDSRNVAKETEAMSTQIQQLLASKADLQKQLDEMKSAHPEAGAQKASSAISGLMKAGMKQHFEEQLLLLTKRLNLTPDQVAAVKAALDAEAAAGEAAAAKIFNGEKVDPSDLAAMKNAKSLDQTLKDILSPEQKTAYQQMQTEEKSNSAEMMANYQLNQVSPMLQLNDSQKDQAYNALYQVQMTTQSPDWIKNNVPNAGSDPNSIAEAQAKAREDAMSKILTPDQMATYHQENQSQLEAQKAMMQKLGSGAGGASQVIVAPGGP